MASASSPEHLIYRATLCHVSDPPSVSSFSHLLLLLLLFLLVSHSLYPTSVFILLFSYSFGFELSSFVIVAVFSGHIISKTYIVGFPTVSLALFK